MNKTNRRQLGPVEYPRECTPDVTLCHVLSMGFWSCSSSHFSTQSHMECLVGC